MVWCGERAPRQTMGRQKTRGRTFSNMENKFTEKHERFLNTLSDRPPPPFRVGDIDLQNLAVGTECPTRVQVSKEIPIPETILGGKRFRRHKVRGLWNAYLWQEGKGVPKMDGRDRWGREGRKGGSKGCKDGILQSMQKRTAPGATMDKGNGNKMLPQRKTEMGKG